LDLRRKIKEIRLFLLAYCPISCSVGCSRWPLRR